jgi:Zn-dependent peptidase ImmA (M78 family)
MIDTAKPEMLALARESRGLTQTQLATKAGLSQAAISKMESGMADLPDERLTQFAEILGYPKAFFYRTAQRVGYESPCFFHRKRQSMPIRKLREIEARINVQHLQVERLLQGVEIDTEVCFDRLDITEYGGSAEEIARLVRYRWRLPLGPIPNLVRAVEAAGGLVVRSSFGTRKLDAVSLWPRGSRPVFFINEEMPAERVRYSLAHEIGHVVMHTEPSQNQEREADRFAAELLMPEAEIRDDLRSVTLERLIPLKLYWRVSMAAIVKHAYSIEAITYNQYRRLNTVLSQMGYRTKEPHPLPPEEPSTIARIIELHLAQRGYTVAQLSELATATEKEFRAQFLNQRQHLRVVT